MKYLNSNFLRNRRFACCSWGLWLSLVLVQLAAGRSSSPFDDRSVAFSEAGIHRLMLQVQPVTGEPGGQGVEMADLMRSNGKIGVVLAVVLLIQAGLWAFMWVLDRRLRKLEKDSGIGVAPRDHGEKPSR